MTICKGTKWKDCNPQPCDKKANHGKYCRNHVPNRVLFDEIIVLQKLAEDMAEGLAWALKWGNFDVSEDNPLHSGAHIKALRALTAYQQATTGRQGYGTRIKHTVRPAQENE